MQHKRLSQEYRKPLTWNRSSVLCTIWQILHHTQRGGGGGENKSIRKLAESTSSINSVLLQMSNITVHFKAVPLLFGCLENDYQNCVRKKLPYNFKDYTFNCKDLKLSLHRNHLEYNNIIYRHNPFLHIQ